MVKSKECKGNALENPKILPVKVPYSHGTVVNVLTLGLRLLRLKLDIGISLKQ
jgi:hypothetical protein